MISRLKQKLVGLFSHVSEKRDRVIGLFADISARKDLWASVSTERIDSENDTPSGIGSRIQNRHDFRLTYIDVFVRACAPSCAFVCICVCA